MISKQPQQNELFHPQYEGRTIINTEKCTGCGICVKNCACVVLELQDGKARVTNPYFCIRCGHCGSVCPKGAIDETGTEPKKITAAELKKTPSSDSLQFLFNSRRSVRQYKKKLISKKDMEKILEAGRFTATGTNSHNIRYLVCNDPEKIAEIQKITSPLVVKIFKKVGKVLSIPGADRILGNLLAERMKTLYAPGMDTVNERINKGEDVFFYNAPGLIIVYGEKYDDTASFSCATALYNCSLMAHTMGIGCCFNGFIQTVINNNSKVKKMLGIPKYMKCWGAMTLGYQDVKFHRLVKRKPVNVKWM